MSVSFPPVGCGWRVAILYGGGLFACRHYYLLVYPSQARALPWGLDGRIHLIIMV